MSFLNNTSNSKAEVNNEFKVTFKFNENGLSFNEILEKSFKNFVIQQNLEYVVFMLDFDILMMV